MVVNNDVIVGVSCLNTLFILLYFVDKSLDFVLLKADVVLY